VKVVTASIEHKGYIKQQCLDVNPIIEVSDTLLVCKLSLLIFNELSSAQTRIDYQTL